MHCRQILYPLSHLGSPTRDIANDESVCLAGLLRVEGESKEVNQTSSGCVCVVVGGGAHLRLLLVLDTD